MIRNATLEGPSAEAQLVEQLTEIERKISDLEAERDALRRLITKVRHRDIATRDVTRKNSFDRILVETQIIDDLKRSRWPVAAATLLKNARSVKFGLKDSTFRSYLHRLKLAGVISPVASRPGHWRLSDSISPDSGTGNQNASSETADSGATEKSG